MITNRDVPLEKAMLLWRPARTCKDTETVDVAIVEHGNVCTHEAPYDQLPYSDGACCSFWREIDQKEKIIELYNLMLLLYFRDKVPIKKIVEAYMCIPEFREALAQDGFDQVIKEAQA